MEKLIQIHPIYWKNWNVSIASCMQVAIMFQELIKKRSSFFGDLNVPKLSEEQKINCEGKISSKECFDLLDSFHNNKTPGNDGIPIEFYDKFWPLISDSFIRCANECFWKRWDVLLPKTSCNHSYCKKKERIAHLLKIVRFLLSMLT